MWGLFKILETTIHQINENWQYSKNLRKLLQTVLHFKKFVKLIGIDKTQGFRGISHKLSYISKKSSNRWELTKLKEFEETLTNCLIQKIRQIDGNWQYTLNLRKLSQTVLRFKKFVKSTGIDNTRGIRGNSHKLSYISKNSSKRWEFTILEEWRPSWGQGLELNIRLFSPFPWWERRPNVAQGVKLNMRLFSPLLWREWSGLFHWDRLPEWSLKIKSSRQEIYDLPSKNKLIFW